MKVIINENSSKKSFLFTQLDSYLLCVAKLHSLLLPTFLVLMLLTSLIANIIVDTINSTNVEIKELKCRPA